MTSAERNIARIQFRLRIHESDGQAYEDLFVAIMNFCEPEFKAIKPNGSQGDRKNDGYIYSKGVYYQVFAPENPTAPKAKTDALRKAKKDFKGLKINWEKISPIQEYWFVFNDKYTSSNPALELLISEIRNENLLSNAGVICSKDLENKLFNLEDDKIQSITGFLPNMSLVNFDVSALSSVINTIIRMPINHESISLLIAPDFEEKIIVNNLSEYTSNILKNGSYQHGNLREYFDHESFSLQSDIRDHLSSLYLQFESDFDLEIPVNTTREDLIFLKLRKTVNPFPSSRSHDAATIAILAYFFECCDIFKEPNVNT